MSFFLLRLCTFENFPFYFQLSQRSELHASFLNDTTLLHFLFSIPKPDFNQRTHTYMHLYLFFSTSASFLRKA